MSNRLSSSKQKIQDTYQEDYFMEKDMEEIVYLEAEWSPSVGMSEDRLDRELSGQVQLSHLEEKDWVASQAWNSLILSFLPATHPVLSLKGEACTGSLLLQRSSTPFLPFALP